MKDESKAEIQVQFRDVSTTSPARLEVSFPIGLSRDKLIAALEKVLKDPQISKLRPRGCLTCLSGLDLNIRERFENVLRFDM